MFSFLMFLVFLSEFSESSLEPSVNEVNSHNKILTSLNVTELNVSTLNVLLSKLKLRNCSSRNVKQVDCRHRCVSAQYLFATHGLNEDKTVSSRDLAELSTSLLYFLLPEKNAGAKNCQDGDNGKLYERFLQYYQTNGHICARLLDKILQDLKNEFKDGVDKHNCFSAVDIFNQMNLSTEHNELDRKQFSTTSVILISHLLDGKCVNIDTDHKEHNDLPCKSYFTSELLDHFGGVDGQISYQSFQTILKSIGLGNKSSHENDEEANNHHHNHRRRKRDISDNYLESKYCYSADELAEIFSVNKSIGVKYDEFSEMCPALIQQLESKSCVKEIHKETLSHNSNSDKHVWLYGFVSVLIISLLSLAGVAVIPTMKGQTYKKIIIVLVGLAIGTLTGDALFHLIPHAGGFHAGSHGSEAGHDSEHTDLDGKAFLWKFLVVASGVYGFFLFETFTHLFLRSDGHGHSHRIEHTRKHSPFERNNSCRTVERHEMRIASSPPPDASIHTHDTTQVIFNQVSGKAEEKCLKTKSDDHNHEDNLPSLLKENANGSNKKTISSIGWMILIGDTIHNITDGIAIGAAFTQDIAGGLSTSIAVFCHELPHELGDFAMLISSGLTIKQAMLANFVSACSSFIGLIIGILIGQQTEEGNQWIFAVMGGMFLYIALVDMLPELMHSEELGGAGRLQIFLLQNIGILLGFMLMLLIAYFEEDLVINW